MHPCSRRSAPSRCPSGAFPAPPDARPAGRLDHAFVGIAAVVAVLEVTVLRPDLPSRWLSLAGFLAWLPTLLVRRTRPMLPVTVFGAVILALLVVSWVTDAAPPGDLNTAIVALLIPFSLARWARGEEAVVGSSCSSPSRAARWCRSTCRPRTGSAAPRWSSRPSRSGAVVRARSMLRTRQLDDVRRGERERLARDLHDTVAHHLTAIAISAQAGLAVAGREPGAATDALRRIDEEATRTLAETRKVLRLLRTDEEAPDRPLADLRGLASGGPGPVVTVAVDDDLDDLSPTVAAALQRIAQEAVANSRRHARDATFVQVRVTREEDGVQLVVTDDGRGSTGSGDGFGIVGMTERAMLLGGRLEAGSLAPLVGWRVTATLPLEEAR